MSSEEQGELIGRRVKAMIVDKFPMFHSRQGTNVKIKMMKRRLAKQNYHRVTSLAYRGGQGQVRGGTLRGYMGQASAPRRTKLSKHLVQKLTSSAISYSFPLHGQSPGAQGMPYSLDAVHCHF